MAKVMWRGSIPHHRGHDHVLPPGGGSLRVSDNDTPHYARTGDNLPNKLPVTTHTDQSDACLHPGTTAFSVHGGHSECWVSIQNDLLGLSRSWASVTDWL